MTVTVGSVPRTRYQLENVTLEMLGRAKSTIYKDDTTIVYAPEAIIEAGSSRSRCRSRR